MDLARLAQEKKGKVMLWTIAGVLAVLWLLGFFVARVGDLIHLVLVLAVIAVLYNLFIGRRRGTRL